MWSGSTSNRFYAVAFELDDPELLDSLTEALALRSGLMLADSLEDADVLVTDRVATASFASRQRVLTVSDNLAGAMSPNAGTDLILSAAHLIAAGNTFIATPREPEFSAGIKAPDPADAHPIQLSPREREVTSLLVDGASNKLIARRLGISVHTAKFHVTAVIRKLGAHNRSEAVAMALKDGLVEL